MRAAVFHGPGNIRVENVAEPMIDFDSDAIVQVMGRDLEAEPVEELSMEAFLARLGYE